MSTALAGEAIDSRRRKRRLSDGDRADRSPGDDRVRIKVEPEEDIKDYAETTMNELLGWYGLDKLDTRGLNLRNLNHFPNSSSSSSPTTRHEDDISEDDTGRSRSPHDSAETTTSSTTGGTITCAWCSKIGLKLFTLKTSSGENKAFCSEPCFNLCRRAAFKKSRVCDWCKHVRHTVNYVDFQDGDHQLQFCSDKCLNQYKMHIFCKETQAYLQMHPHLQEAANKSSGSASSKLITPDLWLRDCQESLNGNQAQGLSDEERPTSNVGGNSSNSGELEDLTSKPRKCNSPGNNNDRELTEHHKIKEISTPHRDKRPAEMCNTLASYLRSDRTLSERRKRHNESDKEYNRKRDRISSSRNKTNHTEAPPAHLSSSGHSMPFTNQRLFPSSTSPYPPPLNSSPSPLNPPAAHTNTVPSHLQPAGPPLPPGLPPPPPLLNNDYLHPQFNSPLYQPHFNLYSQQQFFETMLRMQGGMRHNTPPHVPHSFHESLLPLPPPRPAAVAPIHNPNPLAPPNTIMLPYPVIVPLPVPIPIPIPLSSFLPLKKNPIKDSEAVRSKDSNSIDTKKPSEHEDTNTSKASSSISISELTSTNKSEDNLPTGSGKIDPCDKLVDDFNESEKTAESITSYAVTNNDSETNRLVLKRTKTRTENQSSSQKT